MRMYMQSDATRMVRDLKPTLVKADGPGTVGRDQKTQERWHSCPPVLERHRKDVELTVFCRRSTVKGFSVCNPETDEVSYPP